MTKKVKKVTATLSSKKIKNQKKLFVRVRAFNKNQKKYIYGAWSQVKAVEISK